MDNRRYLSSYYTWNACYTYSYTYYIYDYIPYARHLFISFIVILVYSYACYTYCTYTNTYYIYCTCSGCNLSLQASVWAHRLQSEPPCWIWASTLQTEPPGYNLSFQAAISASRRQSEPSGCNLNLQGAIAASTVPSEPPHSFYSENIYLLMKSKRLIKAIFCFTLHRLGVENLWI